MNAESTGGESITFRLNAPAATLLPPVTAGATRCGAGSLTLTASTNQTGVVYRWYAERTGGSPLVGVTTGSYTATFGQSDTLYVSVFNGNTESIRTSVVARIESAPGVPAVAGAGSRWLCTGGSVSLEVENPNPAYTYTWSNGQTGTTLSVSAPGSFTVQALLGTCQSLQSQAVQVQRPAAPAIAGPATVSKCPTSTVTLSVASPNPAYLYLWSTGEAGSSIAVSAPGTYTVQALVENCTTAASLAVQVVNQILATPAIAGPASVAFCQGGSRTLSVQNPVGGLTYLWSNGIQGATQTVSASGTYTVQAIGQACTSAVSAAVTVSVSLPPTVRATASETSVCLGQPVTLTGSGANTYSWLGGIQNGVPFNPASSGYFFVTGTDANQCQGRDSVFITVRALPQLTIQATATQLCQGQQVTLTGNGAPTLGWTGGVQNGQPFVPAQTQTFTLTGTANGCTATLSQTITVSARPSVGYVASDTSVCQGQSISLFGTGATTYVWDNGVLNGQGFTPTQTTVYTVVGTVAGCSDTARVRVVVRPLPSTPSLTRLGDTLVSSLANGNRWYRNGVWLAAANSNRLVPNQPGRYCVVGWVNNCFSADSACFVVTSLAGNMASLDLRIYPNPASAEIQIEAAVPVQGIWLLNAAGQRLAMRFHAGRVSLADIPAGLYTIEVVTPFGSAYRRLVRE